MTSHQERVSTLQHFVTGGLLSRINSAYCTTEKCVWKKQDFEIVDSGLIGCIDACDFIPGGLACGLVIRGCFGE